MVAKEQHFTRATAKLGVLQSALSHAIRGMEERFCVRFLTRTTRSATPTTGGEQLLERIAPCLLEIEDKLLALAAGGTPFTYLMVCCITKAISKLQIITLILQVSLSMFSR